MLDPKEVFTLTKTLVRVGDFLAQHKFFEKDRRNPKSDDLPLVIVIIINRDVIWGARGVCPPEFWKEKISTSRVVRNEIRRQFPLIF